MSGIMRTSGWYPEVLACLLRWELVSFTEMGKTGQISERKIKSRILFGIYVKFKAAYLNLHRQMN